MAKPVWRRPRALAGTFVIALALALAVWAISEQWHVVVETVRSIGVATLALSALFGTLATAVLLPMWRVILEGLGVTLPLRSAARVFYVSQLGKYVPGSVWPALLQMEAGRQVGATKRTMLAANLITLALSCAVGLIVAAVLLPFAHSRALGHYWWALVALPFLLALLHPRSIPGLMNWLLTKLGRDPFDARVDGRSLMIAALWSLVSWVLFGVQLGLLCNAASPHGFHTYVVTTGAMALAVCAGILFIPAPAGVGVRDAVLVLILSILMSPGAALGVAITARVAIVIGDLLLAGVGALVRHRPPATAGS